MSTPDSRAWLLRHGFTCLAIVATIAYIGGGLAYMFVGSGATLFVNDGFQYYCYLPSLVLDGDLDFTNEYERGRRERSGGEESPFTAVSERTGRPGNAWSSGPALLWAPFFLVGLLLEAGTGEVTGFSLWCQWPAYLGTLVYGLLGLWLLVRWGLPGCEPWARLATVAIILLATNLNYYFLFAGHMSHALSFFAVALHLVCLRMLMARPTDLRWWGFSGLSLGLAGLVRWQDSVIGVLTLLVAADLILKSSSRPRALAGLACGVAGLLPAVVAQALVWNSIYGEPFLVPQGSGFMTWAEPHLFGVLLSYPKGFFLNSPVLVFAVAGLVLHARRDRPWAVGSLLVMALAAYVCAASSQWEAGESFGMRRLVGVLPILAVGLGEFLGWLAVHPRLKPLWAVMGLWAAWNWGLLFLYFLELLKHP